jgi:hypothetical protein
MVMATRIGQEAERGPLTLNLNAGAVTAFVILQPESLWDLTNPGVLVAAILAVCGLVFAVVEIRRSTRASENGQPNRERV